MDINTILLFIILIVIVLFCVRMSTIARRLKDISESLDCMEIELAGTKHDIAQNHEIELNIVEQHFKEIMFELEQPPLQDSVELKGEDEPSPVGKLYLNEDGVYSRKAYLKNKVSTD